MKITLTSLRNTITIAKRTNKLQSFATSISNKKRDISIILTYSPINQPNEDVFPYWKVEMKEESETASVMYGGNDLKKVRDLYNLFISQGNDSYLQKLIPY